MNFIDWQSGMHCRSADERDGKQGKGNSTPTCPPRPTSSAPNLTFEAANMAKQPQKMSHSPTPSYI